jgi:hypothetical protein
MDKLFFFIFFILALIILGFTSWIIILINKKDDLKEDKDFYLNLANLDSGSAYGNIKKLDYSTALQRWKFEGEPRDISLKDILSGKKIKTPDFIVKRVETMAKSKWSAGKNIHCLLPQNASEIPPELMNTFLGKSLAFAIEYANADDIIKKAMQEGLDRVSSHLIEMGEGEVSIQAMTKFKELYKDIDSMYKETRRDRTGASAYPSPSLGTSGG